MAQKFQVGDSVQLKTGGPIMKVEGYDASNPKLVDCVWSINTKTFPEKHLEEKLRLQDANEIKVSNI